MISLGVIGEYLSRIFLEVKGRPTYLIADIVEGEKAQQLQTARSTTTPAAVA
jgi:hypothetical protein